MKLILERRAEHNDDGNVVRCSSMREMLQQPQHILHTFI